MKTKFAGKAIRSKSQYSRYLQKVDELMDLDPTPESTDGKLLTSLAILVDRFERKQGFIIPLARKLKKESLAVRSNSLKVLKDFEVALSDDFRDS